MNVKRGLILVIAFFLLTVGASSALVAAQQAPPTSPPPQLNPASGCDASFWAQPDNAAQWTQPNDPTDDLRAVFSVPEGVAVNGTLLDALNYSTRDDSPLAPRLLLHHAAAALLNASHPSINYPLSAVDIIIQTSNALAGDDQGMFTQAMAFKDNNNPNCSLDNTQVSALSADATTVEELILAINACDSPINLSSNLYTLSSIHESDPLLGASGLPIIKCPITINGNGATIERSSGAAENFRIFTVSGGFDPGVLTLNNVRLTGGNETSEGGGAIYNWFGTLTVAQVSTIENNQTTGTFGGGGILNTFAFLTVRDSIVRGNTSSDEGGGIALVTSGGRATTIDNSTIEGNIASRGAGVFVPFDVGSVFITDTIIRSNGDSFTSTGGGIQVDGAASIQNSILDENAAGNGAALLGNENTSIQFSCITESNVTGSGAAVANTQTDPLLMLIATDNWWGADSGPSGAGPSVSGDSVSLNVDFDNPQPTAPSDTSPVPFTVPAQCDTNPLPVACTGITITTVNVRSGPGTNHPVIASLGSGEQVAILGRYVFDTSPWYLIQTDLITSPDNKWVFSDFVQLDPGCDPNSIPILDDQGNEIPVPPVGTGECLAALAENESILTLEQIVQRTNQDPNFVLPPATLFAQDFVVVTAIHLNRQYVQIKFIDGNGVLVEGDQWIRVRTQLSSGFNQLMVVDCVDSAGNSIPGAAISDVLSFISPTQLPGCTINEIEYALNCRPTAPAIPVIFNGEPEAVLSPFADPVKGCGNNDEGCNLPCPLRAINETENCGIDLATDKDAQPGVEGPKDVYAYAGGVVLFYTGSIRNDRDLTGTLEINVIDEAGKVITAYQYTHLDAQSGVDTDMDARKVGEYIHAGVFLGQYGPFGAYGPPGDENAEHIDTVEIIHDVNGAESDYAEPPWKFGS